MVESFVTMPFVPDNKGKSVIVDKKWASAIFNAQRMYIDTQMALWMSKLSTRKHDKEGKKGSVEFYAAQFVYPSYLMKHPNSYLAETQTCPKDEMGDALH